MIESSDEIIIGWPNIHKTLYSHKSFESLMKIAPELRKAGVVASEVVGKPPNRRKIVWCYPSVFKTYILLLNQNREKKRLKNLKS